MGLDMYFVKYNKETKKEEELEYFRKFYSLNSIVTRIAKANDEMLYDYNLNKKELGLIKKEIVKAMCEMDIEGKADGNFFEDGNGLEPFDNWIIALQLIHKMYKTKLKKNEVFIYKSNY